MFPSRTPFLIERLMSMTPTNSDLPKSKMREETEAKSASPSLMSCLKTPLAFVILVIGIQLLLSSTLVLPGMDAAQVTQTVMNNKVFHHNRTTIGELDLPNSRKPPSATASPASTPSKGKNKTKTKDKSKNNSKNKKSATPVTSSPQIKVSHPVKNQMQSTNFNNYFTAAVNFLNMALAPSSTTPRSAPKAKTKFVPSPLEILPSPQPLFRPQPPTLHPFSVLKTEMTKPAPSSDKKSKANSKEKSKNNVDSKGKNSTAPDLEGRSNFEFEPLYESNYRENDTTGTGTGTGASGSGNKNLKASFLDKFEDHWEDPIAEESAGSGTLSTGPLPAYAPAPYRYDVPWRNKATANRQGPTGPTSFLNEAYDTTATGSGSAPSAPGPHTYAEHKKPNYWPHKLQSYYGDGLTSQLHQPPHQRPHPQSPSHFDGTKHKYAPPPRPNNPHFFNNAVDRIPHKKQGPQQPDHVEPTASASDSVQKTSMIDRVSVFYSDHKLFTWALVSIIAALAALGVLLALYYNSPPTEVVTARQELARSLQDPQLLTFLSNPNLSDVQPFPVATQNNNSSRPAAGRRKRTKKLPVDKT